MTHVSLFTGIGGLDLAAEWAGFETVLQVERDPYCLRVLEKHWPDVPRITDIREVHADDRWIHPTIISGGFPCQPFSQAGKRGGASDDRYLWPQMLRVIRELGPTWVVAENVSGLLSLEQGVVFETVLSDLEREGYEVLPLHYPAAGVGAPHRRDRVFIVAHSLSGGGCRKGGIQGYGENKAAMGEGASGIVIAAGQDVADSDRIGRERRWQEADDRTTGQPCEKQSEGRGAYVADTDNAGGQCGRTYSGVGAEQKYAAKVDSSIWRRDNQWTTEPDVGRLATGVPHRVDRHRLRALGNAVVPQQAVPVFAAIAEAMR